MKRLFSALFCMLLVVAAFADVVAGTFNGFVADDAGVVSKFAYNSGIIGYESVKCSCNYIRKCSNNKQHTE